MPSFGLSRSYQWQNDGAAQLAQILRAQEEVLRQATLEGAYLTDLYVLTKSEEGAATAEAALRQAYQGAGELVVTPVQTRRLTEEEQSYIRLHASTFTQSTREERVAGALEAYRDASLLLPMQLAACTAPVLLEEGLAVTMQERIPAFAFVPDMPGDVVLAHQWSTERGELTQAPLRMNRERFFYTVFAADTGYGKSVAAERLVYETTLNWHYRTVVLDFGAGWRRLLKTPRVPTERVEIHQLFPGAPVPLRWNPWQVGRRIQPERQLVATCEIFKNAGRMGARAAKGLHNGTPPLGYCYGTCSSCEDPNGEGYCPYFGASDRQDYSRSQPLLLHPIEHEAVELAFRWHATARYSDGEIAERLNEYVLTLPDGAEVHLRTKGRWGRGSPGRFSKDTVRDLLQNPYYIGKVPYYGRNEDGGDGSIILEKGAACGTLR